MTREEAKRQIEREDAIRPIKQAYADGKTIQLLDDGNWRDMGNPSFGNRSEQYRVKPDPFEAKVWVKGSQCLSFDEGQTPEVWENSGWKLITVIEKP